MSFLKRRPRAFPAPWSRDHPLAPLHREVDDLFESFLDRFEAPFSELRAGTFPRVDVSETEAALHVTAELPGMDVDEVEVTIDEDALVISGEKESQTEEADEDRTWLRRERTHGAFRRVIALPPDVDLEHVEASFEKGVLHVELPRTAAAPETRRRVEIHTKE
jgi:HSP20 family protein